MESGTPTVASLVAALPASSEGLLPPQRLSKSGMAQPASRKASSVALPGSDHANRSSASGTVAAVAGGGTIGIEDEAMPEEVLLAVSPNLPVAMRRAKWSSGDYVVLEHLHRGHSSIVFKAQCQLSGGIVAVKVYPVAHLAELQRLHLFREIKLHSSLEHANIITFHAAFMENDNVFIVQEFADGGDLLSMLFRYGGKVPEAAYLKLVAVPLLSGIYFMHQHGILHRDIKPENILFTGDGKDGGPRVPKLADLGLAIDMREERPNSNAGTLDYMAPEVLACPLKRTLEENKENPSAPGYGPEADAWAVGAVTYELLVGQPPFKGYTEEDTASFIMTGNLRLPNNLSDAAKDFMNRALARQKGERLRLSDMLRHPWITSAASIHDVPLPVDLDDDDTYVPFHVNGGPDALFEPLPEGDEGVEVTMEDLEELRRGADGHGPQAPPGALRTGQAAAAGAGPGDLAARPWQRPDAGDEQDSTLLSARTATGHAPPAASPLPAASAPATGHGQGQQPLPLLAPKKLQGLHNASSSQQSAEHASKAPREGQQVRQRATPVLAQRPSGPFARVSL